ncbi:primosomal protein N' (replication factor Y) - superfamily II helicase [Pelagovum pacificum]|uniref:Primosomal protein N' (Replication factor Y)-superfamily II helicase n=1 Tax=Pelagovum pacificum TaxID=2588711 RepID=A0A5C5GEK4_9RHOB|nr:primosomal protein N' (replication factor Y) - superfamily II helicase [Pelagovum pacificum]QQA43663.1 primosomal protein N' (replication factor Y) - superfamily II helicase [Pelagovum pacificum]TNY33202.1 primosomal protein N' (replication factor Y) - superfamily II helicase [Pelagovum pacificum]
MAEEHHFPCDTCGGDMRFDPGDNRMICDHCGATQPIEEDGPWAGGSIRELDFEAALRGQVDAADIEETRTVKCPNCGAEVEFEEATHATECPFCATPVVTGTGTSRHIKPRGLLPFGLEEEQARDEMTKWLGRLWFAPNGLKQYARKGRKLNGIYVPYWTFDADTTSRYTGQRGEDYYVTRTVTRGGERKTIRERKTRWYSAAGQVARFFDDVLVLASRSLPKSYTDGLAPWDLSELEPYKPEFLAGFRAEAYQVELDEGFAEARDYMDRMILRDVKYDIGGDRQRVHDISTDVRDVTFKHILLPVWMAAYRYNGKSYRFVVNGRTGKVQGERPYSAWKIAFAVILGLIVAAGVGYLYANG